jgi:hypothetical protein
MGKLMAAPRPMHPQSHRRHLQNLPLMAVNLLQRTRMNPHLQRLHLLKKHLQQKHLLKKHLQKVGVEETTTHLRLHDNRE